MCIINLHIAALFDNHKIHLIWGNLLYDLDTYIRKIKNSNRIVKSRANVRVLDIAL